MKSNISVVITTHNRRYEVKRAVESVLNQSVQPLEIILVDDASDDLTEYFIKSYEYQNLNYIRLENNVGPGAARNIGIKEAKGEYIAFLDSDNEWMHDKIAAFSQVISDDVEYDIYFSKYLQHINFETVEYPLINMLNKEDLELKAIENNLIDASSAIYKKSNFEKYGFFSEEIRTNIDWEIGLRWRLENKIKCKFIDAVLTENHPMYNSLTNDWNLTEIDKNNIIKQYKIDCISMSENKRIGNSNIAYKYRTGCLMYNFENIDMNFLDIISECLKNCERLLVCIPDDELILRMTGSISEHNYEQKSRLLLEMKGVFDVIPIDVNNISKVELAKRYNIDSFFYGSEYGLLYQKEKKELLRKGIEMISLQSQKISIIQDIEADSLYNALKSITNYKKVILFGTGKYFEFYMKYYGKKFKPAFAVDNNKLFWNTEKDGILIKNPKELEEEDPGKVLIIICCKEYSEIREQILQISDFDYRTLRYINRISQLEEFYTIYCQERKYLENAHRILKLLLKELVEMCDKYKLHYYIISGSLIGIVRHHNQIPWDDDIDIAIPRNDYNKLKKIIKEEWKNSNEFLYLEYDELGENCFYDFMSRIVYIGEEIPTQLFRRAGSNVRKDILNHMVLDLYVLDDTFGGWRHYLNTTTIKLIYALAMGHRDTIDFSEYDKMSKIELLILKIVCHIGKNIPLKLLFNWYEKVRTSAYEKGCKLYYESCGVITYMPMIYSKKLYGEGIKLRMDDLQVMVPTDYEYLLKEKGYGMFMNFPAINHRQPSHAPGKCNVIW